jgi:hypothetical protein
MAERGHFGDRLRSAWCLFWDATKNVGLGITIAVGGIIGGLLYPLVLKDQTRKALLRLYREGKNLALAKPITLRADPEELFVDAASGSSTIRWKYIERADQTTDHLFLFTSAMNAVVVPKAVPTTSTRSPTWRPSFAVMLRRLRTRTIKHPSDLAAGLSPDRFRRANNLRLRELSHS